MRASLDLVRRDLRSKLAASIAALLLASCHAIPRQEPAPVETPASRPAAPPASPSGPRPAASTEPPAGAVVTKNERWLLYTAGAGDTLRSIARQFLGDEARDWEIAELNSIQSIRGGDTIAVPLRPVNPYGVSTRGYQTVPILAYHRFGAKDSRMVVTVEAFAAQLAYLARNDYRVIRLSELRDFLAGRRALHPRSVVITIDDGYVSVYQHAYPLLKKHHFPATVFVYTDFAGAGDALTWSQMKEMVDSGLIDVESHSKTHANLAYRLPWESDGAYRRRLDEELLVPKKLLRARLGNEVRIFAYPYGDANPVLVDRLGSADYQLGLTVKPGGNPFFANPMMLQRTMIFGEDGLDEFKVKLQTFQAIGSQ
jgi:peptidoglycan/xylan/chitin deacetylase (PgdA/CDA1 family)